ncbi:hypothetical protein evm_012251 [Chilo suppressalis]|nr:hypothetical protein evm_012251 [Chilo suppressalis]
MCLSQCFHNEGNSPFKGKLGSRGEEKGERHEKGKLREIIELPIGSGSMKKPSHYKIIHHKNVPKRKLIKASSSDQLKKLYFKKKCLNAVLERKKLMLDILHKKKEHELRMQILKKQLSTNNN